MAAQQNRYKSAWKVAVWLWGSGWGIPIWPINVDLLEGRGDSGNAHPLLTAKTCR